MSRVRRGFRLAGISWRVVVAEPIMLAVLLVGIISMVALSASLFFLLFGRLPAGRDFRFPNYLIALPVLWFGSIAATFCNVVVTVMADRRLRGDTASVGEAMGLAATKVPAIVSWTVVSIAVGLILQVLAERLKLAGYLAARLFGLGWGLATTFIIPVLAFEGLSVTGGIRRSAAIFKAKWGETVVAQGTVGIAVMLAILPLALLAAFLIVVAGPVGVAMAVVLFAGLVLVSGALDAVVDVALYRYAVDGSVVGAFTADDLDALYRPKRRGGNGADWSRGWQ